MKWFKHLVDSGDDPDIDGSSVLFGSDGPWVFFRTLEIMSREFDYEKPGFNSFMWDFYRKKFRISARKLREICEYFNEKERIFCRFYKNDKVAMIDLNCPKLRSLCDEHTRKVLSKKSGVNQESVREKSHIDNRQQKQTTETDMFVLPDEPVLINPKGGVFFQEIMKKADKIYKLSNNSNGSKKINIYAWVNSAIKINGHPKAIDEALNNLINRWDRVTSPWPYIESIFKLKNGNFWEEEHIKESEDFNREWVSQVALNPDLNNLLKDFSNDEN